MVVPCALYLRFLFIHQGALHAGAALNGNIRPVPRRTASFVKVFYHPQFFVFFLMHLTPIFSAPFACNPILRNVLYLHGGSLRLLLASPFYTSGRFARGLGAKREDPACAAAYGFLRQGFLPPATLRILLDASYTYFTTRRGRRRARQIAKSSSKTTFSRCTMVIGATGSMSRGLRAIIGRNSMLSVRRGEKLHLPAQQLLLLRVVSVRARAERLLPQRRRFEMRVWSPEPHRRQPLRLRRKSRSCHGRLLLPHLQRKTRSHI